MWKFDRRSSDGNSSTAEFLRARSPNDGNILLKMTKEYAYVAQPSLAEVRFCCEILLMADQKFGELLIRAQ